MSALGASDIGSGRLSPQQLDWLQRIATISAANIPHSTLLAFVRHGLIEPAEPRMSGRPHVDLTDNIDESRRRAAIRARTRVRRYRVTDAGHALLERRKVAVAE